MSTPITLGGTPIVVEFGDSTLLAQKAAENAAAEVGLAQAERVLAEAARDKARDWSQGTTPDGPGTKSAKEWSEAASSIVSGVDVKATDSLKDTYSSDRNAAAQRQMYWPVKAVFEQGYFNGSGVETANTTYLRTVDRIPVKAGDVFTTSTTGLWVMAAYIFDAAGTFIAATTVQATKGGVTLIPNDGFARLIIRKNPAVNVTPADVLNHDPGIRMVPNLKLARPLNPGLGPESVPRGALASATKTVTNLPILLGGFLGDNSPAANATRASTTFLHLGKGSVITTTDGFEFARYIYNSARENIGGDSTWNTSITVANDMLVRLHLHKSDNSSLVGIDTAPWLTIDWVQPALVTKAGDIADGVITIDHLSFDIPGAQPAPDSFHLVWLLGESHVAGRAPTMPDPVIAGSGYKYIRSSTSLGQLADPTGNDSTALLGRGSYGPAIGKSMLSASGGSTGAIIVNSAMGGSKISEWASGQPNWTQALADIAGAIAAIKAAKIAISGCSIVIGLGSNDAGVPTPKADFKAGELDLIGRARTALNAGEVPAGIVLTAPFANGTSYAAAVAYIQEAEVELANEESGVFLLTDVTRYAISRGWYIDTVHMNQTANDNIGRAGGPALFVHGAGRAPAGLA
ncbi:hypothetical protein FHR22_002630 [Sphingopyxis panaciterrae]|uniref:hypothetical protein n=1 Tax=Sphingopyxis panaciterrae TaxID=363841 RepID=UPI001422D349|nr:hypothetical protein [Sphingopyxis panaciterrae]NIJ37927.1 hypothetical protein [Sphingopyxis panaciterrae]